MPYNETEGRDAHGRWTAGGALAASAEANKASLVAKQKPTSRNHRDALRKHAIAAEAHTELGNTQSANIHSQRASEHAAKLGTEAPAASGGHHQETEHVVAPHGYTGKDLATVHAYQDAERGEQGHEPRGSLWNASLYEGTGQHAQHISDMDKAIAKGSLKQDTQLYRVAPYIHGFDHEAAMQPGVTFKMAGFQSAAPGTEWIAKRASTNDVILKINAPKGLHAYDFSMHTKEKGDEIVLPRNLTMKVVAQSQETISGKTLKMIHMQVVK